MTDLFLILTYFMISRDHPKTVTFLKSRNRVRNEEINHLWNHYYMIHPFSLFNLHWTYVMTFFYWVYFIVIPFHFGLPMSTYGDTRWILMICHTFHIVHIVLCFFTGYHNKQKNIIIMDKNAVAKRYLLTYFFPEFFSLGPLILTDVRLYKCKPTWIFEGLSFLLYLKLVRVGTWLDNLEMIKEHFQISLYNLTLFKLLMGFISIILWAHALLKFTKLKRWSETYIGYLMNLEEITELILQIGPRKETKSLGLAIVTICLGFVFQLLTYVWIAHFWHKFSSVSSKKEGFYRELDAFMMYKTLSIRKQKRIRMYFNFKYQGDFYKEPALQALLSRRLRSEVMSTISENSIKKVDMFKYLPKDILEKFTEYLVCEIYLPGDIIVSQGTMGDAIYFITSGTVGITAPNGTHINFLKDGAHFGEIALILGIPREFLASEGPLVWLAQAPATSQNTKNNLNINQCGVKKGQPTHVATVVAISPCEILRLRRCYFLSAFKRCESALEELKKIANNRMTDLGDLKPIISQTKLDMMTVEQSLIDKALTKSEVNLIDPKSVVDKDNDMDETDETEDKISIVYGLDNPDSFFTF